MQVTTFLMFTGRAEEAMTFYTSLFPGSRVVTLDRYGPEGPGKEGTVRVAELEVAGTRLKCIDSPVAHPFTFTPAMSLFVDCDSRAQLDDLCARLGAGGTALMPPGNYGFSTWFAWIQDRFGVSWQLNLP